MVEIEQSVLGCIILEKSSLEEVIDLLIPDLFQIKTHRTIFEAILKLREENSGIDTVTIMMKLKQDNNLESVGGAVYLSGLTGQVGSTAHLEDYVRILQQRHIKKSIKIVGESMIMTSEKEDSLELLNNAEKELSRLNDLIFKGSVNYIGSAWKAMIERMNKMSMNGNGLSGIDTGLKILNSMTNGWQEPDLITLAARPGMGKTSMALKFVSSPALKHNIPTAIFSLEMSAIQLTQRIASQESSIPLEKIIHNKFDSYERELFQNTGEIISNAPIYIDDTAGISIPEFKSKASRLKREHNVRLIVIDYLQLMQSGKGIKDATQETTAISNALKVVAKDLDIPIIVLSQLSRDVEKRGGDKRPQLSDLRQSGAIEQDSDMVIFLYRAEYYGIMQDEEGYSTEGLAELIIAKFRNGRTGIAKIGFENESTNFIDRG